MKKVIHKALGIAIMAFFSQASMAIDVTSTFTTGATLTATQMTEIKDAVNSKLDNGTDVVTSTHIATDAVNSAEIVDGAVGAAEIAIDSVIASDMQNEPGIEYSTLGSSSSLTTSWILMETLTVTAPSSGYVYCVTTGFIDVVNLAATNYVQVGWAMNDTSLTDPDNMMWSRQDGGTNEYTPITSMNTYLVTAGTHTFSYKVAMQQGTAGDLQYFERGYSCMFFPTRY
jgi:hypothetical protein